MRNGKQVIFAITGATGLLGSNLVWEIIKQNYANLDLLQIIWLGREKGRFSLKQRIASLVDQEGCSYLGIPRGSASISEIASIITPIACDFNKSDLALTEADLTLLKMPMSAASSTVRL